jgi:hypothetical protein
LRGFDDSLVARAGKQLTELSWELYQTPSYLGRLEALMDVVGAVKGLVRVLLDMSNIVMDPSMVYESLNDGTR